MKKKKRNVKKELLDDFFSNGGPDVDEQALEKKIESGEIQPVNTYVSTSISDSIKIALCKTIVDFKNRKKLMQKDLVDILESDKSTISLVCR